MGYNRVEMVATAIVVMGVAGVGKTTVGRALAAALACPFFDGDDFHPPANVAKMAAGIPLQDADRAPWLTRLHDLLVAYAQRGQMIVLAASVLKRKYRAQLRTGDPGVVFVYLEGDFDLVWQRLAHRHGHYMKANMLRSQFADLEPPTPDEALIVPASGSVSAIVDDIVAALTTRGLLGD